MIEQVVDIENRTSSPLEQRDALLDASLHLLDEYTLISDVARVAIENCPPDVKKSLLTKIEASNSRASETLVVCKTLEEKISSGDDNYSN